MTLFFNINDIHIMIIYEKNMKCMDEESVVFETVKLSVFNLWNCTALKTFHNNNIIMTNISNNRRIP